MDRRHKTAFHRVSGSSRTSSLVGYVFACVIFIAAGAVLALWASTSVPSVAIADPLDIGDESEGVAATIAGEVVGEVAVSRYIDDFRNVQGLEDDASWGLWLVESGYTPEMMRRDTAESLARQLVLRDIASDHDALASESQVDEAVRAARRLHQGNGDWLRYLAAMNLTEAGYRFDVETRYCAEAIAPHAPEASVEDASVLALVREREERYSTVASLDEVDDETRSLYYSVAKRDAFQKAVQKELEDAFAQADFQLLDMPEGLSYDIDLEPYATALRESSYGEEEKRGQSPELLPWGPVQLKTTQELQDVEARQSSEWKTEWLVDREDALADYDEICASYAEARAANSEVFCWLSVPGADLSVPVLQSAQSDDYYMYRGTNRQMSIAGAVYAQRITPTTLDAPISVLYGHCSETREIMFTKLHRYEDADFFGENPLLYIHQQERTLVYLVLSSYEYDSRHLVNSFDLDDLSIRQDVFDFIANPNAKGALVREGVRLDSSRDKVVQLSGCTLPISSDRRFVVAAVLLGEVEHH